MNDEYNLSFIDQNSFENHVQNTINTYIKSLRPVTLTKFNSNVIDPIKLLFDKNVYDKSYQELIADEIQRQKDKSNTNAIGYFHQYMFQSICDCEVPKEGWDVIVNRKTYKIYVEMKNKYNTMNAASSQKTYIQMQNQIAKHPNDYCYLVEVIAPKSRNVPWACSVNKKSCIDERIRRVSIDQFYKEVTRIDDAFYQICIQLPKTITKLINKNSIQNIPKDTVIEELNKNSPDYLTSLYKLAFSSYEGFNKL